MWATRRTGLPGRTVAPADDGPVSLRTDLSARRRGPLVVQGRAVDLGSALDGAPRWVAGVLAALQGALLSWLVVVVPSVAAFVATSADPANNGVPWARAVGVGTAVWLLGHGIPVTAGAVTVGLVPLGITALAAYTCHASARRSGEASWSAALGGVATYVLVVVGLAALTPAAGGGLLRAATGGAVVAVLGLATGLLRRPEAPSVRELTQPVWRRLPGTARVSLAVGALAAALLGVVASLVVCGWLLDGHTQVAALVGGLNLDVIGGVVLAVAQLGYLPNVVVWALAWVSGAGFSVGTGSRFAPDSVVSGSLPAVPLLGMLPAEPVHGLGAVMLPLVLGCVGALAGLVLHRRWRALRWWHPAAAAGLLAAVVAALVAVAVTAASGAAGPGRMAQVGAEGWLVGLRVGLPVWVGAAVTATAAAPAVHQRLRRLVGWSARDDGVSPGEPSKLDDAVDGP